MIRTIKLGRKTYYTVKDIINELGFRWDGFDSIQPFLGDKAEIIYDKVKCDDGIRRVHLMTDYAGKTSLEYNINKEFPEPTPKNTAQTRVKEIEARLAEMQRNNLRGFIDKVADKLNASPGNKSEASSHNAIYTLLYTRFAEQTGTDLVALNKADKKTGNRKQSVLEFAQNNGYINDLQNIAKKEFGVLVND